MDTKILVLLLGGSFLILLGIAIQFFGMLVDSQCNQLEPNENYKKTICEKYWR